MAPKGKHIDLLFSLVSSSSLHLSAISYLCNQAEKIQLSVPGLVKKPKYIDAEDLSHVASCSMAAIICSYAMLEAQINDFVGWCNDPEETIKSFGVFDKVQLVCIHKATTIPGFERLETLQKFQQLLRITDKQQFETDKDP